MSNIQFHPDKPSIEEYSITNGNRGTELNYASESTEF